MQGPYRYSPTEDGGRKVFEKWYKFKEGKRQNEQKTRGEKVFFALLSGHNVKGYC